MRTSLDKFKFSPSAPSSLRRSARFTAIKQEEQEEEDRLPSVASSSSTHKTSKKRSASEITDLWTESTKDSPNDRRKRSRSPTKLKKGYALPEVYAHLGCLTDRLREELDVIFVGINPGVESAKKGAHFAHPTNHFWRCLHLAGFTDRRVAPTEEHILPEQFNIGLTDLVDRPSSEAAELSKAEKIAAVPKLLEKFSRCRPRFVCFVGKVIWDVVEPVLKKNKCAIPEPAVSLPAPGDDSTGESGKPSGSASPISKKTGKNGKSTKEKKKGTGKKPPFPYHLPLPYKLVHDYAPDSATVKETLFFVVPSTSGLVAGYQLKDKARFFTALKVCLEEEKLDVLDKTQTVPVRIAFS
ncbi:DNA glycosylase [Stereum hirsutum FP-91666 SS1]|uniref:DNA glycosylase n=1 Tax=Stereum hirsutum (strain FP-91666) TaxID=721885 RepID=UPI00044495EA|nr:DNA glycosylase [Stereum hirsutum FP-91666 SS1]EIM81873.1 DNA glycosylase [Stereum hirsutum FP-91666 SS1]